MRGRKRRKAVIAASRKAVSSAWNILSHFDYSVVSRIRHFRLDSTRTGPYNGRSSNHLAVALRLS